MVICGLLRPFQSACNLDILPGSAPPAVASGRKDNGALITQEEISLRFQDANYLQLWMNEKNSRKKEVLWIKASDTGSEHAHVFIDQMTINDPCGSESEGKKERRRRDASPHRGRRGSIAIGSGIWNDSARLWRHHHHRRGGLGRRRRR